MLAIFQFKYNFRSNQNRFCLFKKWPFPIKEIWFLCNIMKMQILRGHAIQNLFQLSRGL
jgi:hypothetical protein